MDASKKQREPVAFKSLAELKRFIRPGVEFKTVSHANHADMVGLTRVVTTVQTVGFVNVVESKERLFEVCTAHGVPAIVAMGRKGGSNVAAAICNALVYSAAGMLDPTDRGWK